ncbi:hypothetical protein D9R12_04480 [Pseudoxanthomonas spadix]|nr:hypothetical protein D9R12_04480 [Pseudoxanthomonas spadix]
MPLTKSLDGDLPMVQDTDARTLVNMGQGNAAWRKVHAIAPHQPIKTSIQTDFMFKKQSAGGCGRRRQPRRRCARGLLQLPAPEHCVGHASRKGQSAVMDMTLAGLHETSTTIVVGGHTPIPDIDRAG